MHSPDNRGRRRQHNLCGRRSVSSGGNHDSQPLHTRLQVIRQSFVTYSQDGISCVICCLKLTSQKQGCGSDIIHNETEKPMIYSCDFEFFDSTMDKLHRLI